MLINNIKNNVINSQHTADRLHQQLKQLRQQSTKREVSKFPKIPKSSTANKKTTLVLTQLLSKT